MNITVSVLAWHSTVYLARLLKNFMVNPPSRRTFSLVVVDQGSGPETKAILRQAARIFDNLHVISLNDNCGYAAGHNLAYDYALARFGVDYFVPLNDDVSFDTRYWLDELVRHLDNAPGVGLGGPTCYSIVPGMARPATEEELRSGSYHFVATPVAILRAAAVRDAGLFDEAYTPAYWEDADLSMRWKQFGWGLMHIPLAFQHKDLGPIERGLSTYKDELADKYGDFAAANIARFFARWKSPEARNAFNRDTLATLCPGLYRPL